MISRRLRRYAVAGLVTALLPLTATAFNVTDPKNLLPTLANHFPRAVFETVMACGQSAEFEATHSVCDVRCSDLICQSKCSTALGVKAVFGVHIDECSGDQVQVFSDIGLAVAVTRAEFVAASSTWLTPFLKGLGAFVQPDLGDIEIERLSQVSMPYIENGRMRTLRGVLVRTRLRQSATSQTVGIQVVLLPEFTGVRQIGAVWMGAVNDSDRDILFKLRGLILPTDPLWGSW